jgi:hypothetical protein
MKFFRQNNTSRYRTKRGDTAANEFGSCCHYARWLAGFTLGSCNVFLHTARITAFIGAYSPPTTNVWLTLTRVQHKSSLQVRLTPNHIAYESARLAICARQWPDPQDKAMHKLLSKRLSTSDVAGGPNISSDNCHYRRCQTLGHRYGPARRSRLGDQRGKYFSRLNNFSARKRTAAELFMSFDASKDTRCLRTSHQ